MDDFGKHTNTDRW